MRWSPSRVTNALEPFGVNTTWLGLDLSLPSESLAIGSTVLPFSRSTDTVPSSRLATSASVERPLIDTPAAPAPTLTVWITLGGAACRSITLSTLSDTSASFTARLPEVTSAKDSSGATATATGGPMTVVGAWTSATSRGAGPRRSITATVSGGGSVSTFTTPLSSTALPSLADSAIQPRPAAAPGAVVGGAAQAANRAQT